MMPDPAIAAQLAREVSLAELVHVAEQYSAIAAAVRTGDASQELLRAARERLERTALALARAHGYQRPAPDAPESR